MITEALNAWVLHKTSSGETSARVTFFTLEKGIFTWVSKGGRSPKKQALLQPFLPLWLSVELRKNHPFLRSFEEQEAPLEFKGPALFAGLYTNELLFYALKPIDSQPELFKAYV